MALLPNDLLIINREGVSYKYTFENLKEDVGGTLPIQPLPGQISAVPAFEGGSGTIGDPYIITPITNAFIGGLYVSNQVITVGGQDENRIISITDNNVGANGARFNQPLRYTNALGQAQFQLEFNDNPVSQTQPTYNGLLKFGEIYFSWTVSIGTSGIAQPVTNTIIDENGNDVSPPQEPIFFRANGKVTAIELDSDISGLTLSTTNVAPIEITANGQTALVMVSTTSTDSIHSITIIDSSDNWAHETPITLNLTSLGGPNNVNCKVLVGPTVPGVLTISNSAPNMVNAGAYVKTEYLFSEDPDFTVTKSFETTEDPSLQYVSNYLPTSKSFYYKFRYVSDLGAQSPYSMVYSATNSDIAYVELAIDANGMLDGLNRMETEPFALPTGKNYFLLFNKDNEVGKGGLAHKGAPWTGRPGSAKQIGIWLLRRDVAFWKITGVSSGAVTAVEIIGKPIGLERNGRNKVVTAETCTGVGSGLELRLNANADQTIVAAVETGGTQYQIDDIVRFQQVPADTTTGANNTLVDDLDILVYGLAGQGGDSASGSSGQIRGEVSFFGQGTESFPQEQKEQPGGPVPGDGTAPGVASGSLYPSDGESGSQSDRGDAQTGGGGGAGWGGGDVGPWEPWTPDNNKNVIPGGPGYSAYLPYMRGQTSTKTISGENMVVTINGEVIISNYAEIGEDLRRNMAQ